MLNSDLDECATNNGGCAPNMATCTNQLGADPSCACNTGYTGNGTVCADVDECTDGTVISYLIF